MKKIFGIKVTMVKGPVERISCAEIINDIKVMKSGKAAGSVLNC